MPVRVAAITKVADSVKRFRLERADGGDLPVFSGGAHVVVAMQDGRHLRRNPYSLMSSPLDRSAFEISVLRVEKSPGWLTLYARSCESWRPTHSHPALKFVSL